MELKRKIDKYLTSWLNTKKGLIVDGARQVGKTHSLKKFGNENFDVFIYINLIENKQALQILSKSEDSKDFIFRLESLVNTKLIKGKTCIFIDEIQEFKDFDFITLTKFLIDEGSYRYIFSGSMLGVELNNVKSWPVGYVSSITMYPLDFEEFCINTGLNENIFIELKDNFITKTIVKDYIHDKMMSLFRQYIVIGGMPDIVSNYLDGKNINELGIIYNAIIDNNKKDITKYVEQNKKLKIKEIYDLMSFELNKQNKRFILKDIKNKSKNENIDESLLWIRNAGLSIPVYNAKDLTIPLMINSDRNILKLFYEDVGILNAILLSKESRLEMLKDDLNLNYGAIYENFVAQELNAHGFNNIYYYNNKKNGELDFVIEFNGKVLPIEIKSGKEYKKHSAINNILNINNYNITEAYVFNNENLFATEKIIYMPIYMVSFFDNDRL